ncbi:MAG: hypothetical protein RML33_11135 [Acidobacteriota bacterium]|nr:hypothetical protein [Leptospiraceae bacterium]MDW8305374.1 hypothetical protein [Acidobacteriota bacterium]
MNTDNGKTKIALSLLEKLGFPILVALLLLWNNFEAQKYYQKLIELQDQKLTQERNIFLQHLEAHRQQLEKLNQKLETIAEKLSRK